MVCGMVYIVWYGICCVICYIDVVWYSHVICFIDVVWYSHVKGYGTVFRMWYIWKGMVYSIGYGMINCMTYVILGYGIEYIVFGIFMQIKNYLLVSTVVNTYF